MSQQGASSSISTQVKQSDDTTAWQTLFLGLIENQPALKEAELNIQVTDKELKLSTHHPQLIPTLSNIFDDPRAMREGLCVVLKQIFNEHQSSQVLPPQFDYLNSTAEKALKRLFAADLLKATGLEEMKLSPNHDNVKAQELSFEIPKLTGHKDIWQGRIKMLKAAIKEAGIESLRKAYFNKGPLISFSTSESEEVELEQQFNDILCIRDNKVVIDYGKLLALLFPQAPAMKASLQGDSYQVTINKKKTLDFIKFAFPEGFIIAKKLPVLLPQERLVKAKIAYSLVLDCSDSMNSVFDEYLTKVVSLCDKLVEQSNPGDKVRIVDFDGSIRQDICITLGVEKESDKLKLKTHIKALELGYDTALYESVKHSLEWMDKETECDHCFVIFTDGQNRCYKVSEAELVTDIQKRSAPGLKRVPKIYTMGLGKEYRKDLLESWATQTGVVHTHLKEIADFAVIEKEAQKMKQPRLLVDLIQGLFKERVSVFDEVLTLAQHPLEEDMPFHIGQHTYRYQSNAPGNAPQPSRGYLPNWNWRSLLSFSSSSTSVQIAGAKKEDALVSDMNSLSLSNTSGAKL